MKKILLFILGGLFIFSGFTQEIANLEGINYQAVALDTDDQELVGVDVVGKPLYEKEIGVRFTLLSGPDGAIYYQETHTTTTDKYGLFSLVIGLGENTFEGEHDVLMDIPWINGDQFLKVEISINNDGSYHLVSNSKLMAVPFSFYTDDIADNSITSAKIVDETIQAEDIDTSAVTTSEILDETILAEDIATGAVTTDEILDETILAEDIATGAVTTDEILDETILAEDIATGAVTTDEILDETILAEDIATGAVTTDEILDETILAEDIATGAVTTDEILDETILAEDIATGAVTTDEILDETILAEDIATGAVTTDEILDETILAEDIATGAVTTDEILDETILAEDIATGAVTTDEILDETILAEDIATGAVTTSEILDETILAEDIATGAVTTDEILNETILAEDIATGAVTTDEILDGTINNVDIQDATIDLNTKVSGVLPVQNGGTGIDASSAAPGTILIGNGTGFTLDSLTAGIGINITNTPGGIQISSGVDGVTGAIAGTVNPGVIASGDTWISPAIPLSGVEFGNIVVGSINASLDGCQMTTYVTNPNIIRVAIYNGTGTPVNIGMGLELRVLVVE